MKRLNPILAVLLIAIASVTSFAQRRAAPPVTIKEEFLRGHIKFLSDDQLEGRGTGAPGGELAAKYIATQLEAMGLIGPGKGGSFFQPVSLVGVKADPKTTLTLTSGGKSETLK